MTATHVCVGSNPTRASKGDNMKQCSDCGGLKPTTEFYWKDKKHTTLNSKCKHCSNKRMADLRRERYERIQEYKTQKGCKVCGETRHWVLDLHHRDEDTKEYTISNMLRKNMSWENILAELEKCDVLCANCHRDWHYKN